jgi:hypothetical protein
VYTDRRKILRKTGNSSFECLLSEFIVRFSSYSFTFLHKYSILSNHKTWNIKVLSVKISFTRFTLNKKKHHPKLLRYNLKWLKQNSIPCVIAEKLGEMPLKTIQIPN